MKPIAFIIISLICAFSVSAQYYNPYNNPYANQQAYEYGRRMAEQMQQQQQAANQQAYNMGKAMGSYQMGLLELYNGNYEDAYNCFDDAETYKYAPAYEALGIMNELGISVARDTDWAKMMYEEGARLGNIACKQHLRRIKNNGFYSASTKTQWLQNFRNSYAAQHSGAGNYHAPNTGDGNVDIDHSCRACNNTGVCNGCHGSGFSYGTTRCNMCHGSGKCMNCGGKGWL